ncbi:unnamed protein product [Amoebophrya sp. A120]|nr:unnamed protein product [Amoebophrya sp. A120]|eukprot:GSA120T00022007001.1
MRTFTSAPLAPIGRTMSRATVFAAPRRLVTKAPSYASFLGMFPLDRRMPAVIVSRGERRCSGLATLAVMATPPPQDVEVKIIPEDTTTTPSGTGQVHRKAGIVVRKGPKFGYIKTINEHTGEEENQYFRARDCFKTWVQPGDEVTFEEYFDEATGRKFITKIVGGTGGEKPERCVEASEAEAQEKGRRTATSRQAASEFDHSLEQPLFESGKASRHTHEKIVGGSDSSLHGGEKHQELRNVVDKLQAEVIELRSQVSDLQKQITVLHADAL